MGKKELIKRAIELCLAVYRVTDKFPANEVLREKLRNAALDIVEVIIYDLEKGPTIESRFFNPQKLEVILAHFNVAKRQNWVEGENFEILAGAYCTLYSDNQKETNLLGEAYMAQRKIPKSPNERQDDIIGFLRQHKEGANLADLSQFLKLSKRSVNRELAGLIAQGIVFKKGVTKGAKFIAA